MCHNDRDSDSGATARDKVASTSNSTVESPTSASFHRNTEVAIASHRVSTIDITDVFTAATSVLRTGQLVKDEFFTLFEAVGALEIMDSKMDSGHLGAGETLEDEYDVLQPLLPEQVLGIMDQTLCHEVAWHKGHPLSQTLFTSMYIERLLWPEPKSLDEVQFLRNIDRETILRNPLVHQVLRPYCIATVKACHFVYRLIMAESYYEEEDFTSQLYHRELLPKIPTAEIRLLLDEALSYLATTNIPLNIQSAIQSRLVFRKSLLTALEQDGGPLDARTKTSVSCVPMLRDIKDTAKLGEPVSDCFSTKIQRSLASSVPPRPMVTINFFEALSYLETLCNDAADIDELLGIRSGDDLFTAISVFTIRRPRPSVYIRALIQSFLAERETGLVLGHQTLKRFLFSSLESLVLPNNLMLDPKSELLEAPTNPAFQSTCLLAQFSEKAGQHYLNGLRTACLNRSRTRRSLCHLLLDLDVIQADAEDLDNTLRAFTAEKPAVYGHDQPTFSYPLSSWVYHHKLIHMRQIIQTGFELSIYSPDELAGMYWYLSYVCGTHLSHIDRMGFFVQRDLETQDDLFKKSSLPGDTDAQDRKHHEETLNNLFRIHTLLKAIDALSRALHAVYTLFLRHEAIEIPGRPYSSDQLRYELRMKPFLFLTLPEPVDFDTFRLESSFVGLDDQVVIEEASAKAAEARQLWEQVLKAGWSSYADQAGEAGRPSQKTEIKMERAVTTIEGEWRMGVKNVIRSCIATSICVATLRNRLKERGALKNTKATVPEPGNKGCWHDWWTVPQLHDRK